jgi:hypothetical protein
MRRQSHPLWGWWGTRGGSKASWSVSKAKGASANRWRLEGVRCTPHTVDTEEARAQPNLAPPACPAPPRVEAHEAPYRIVQRTLQEAVPIHLHGEHRHSPAAHHAELAPQGARVAVVVVHVVDDTSKPMPPDVLVGEAALLVALAPRRAPRQVDMLDARCVEHTPHRLVGCRRVLAHNPQPVGQLAQVCVGERLEHCHAARAQRGGDKGRVHSEM